MKVFFSLVFLLFTFFSTAFADEKITDIQIEGLQRLDPGLIFNNIPFEIDDDISKVDYSKTINLLYKTGHFKDIIVEREGSVIIISVREKPILFEINFSGTQVFQPEQIKSALAQLGISTGLVLDETDLRFAEKQIEEQYLSYGKYNASVKAQIIPLSNNRVNVMFNIDEGGISRIKEIKILGNKSFNSDNLIDEMELKTTNFMSWWYKDDRYSKQTLSGDLEKITSYYLDRGYIDFKITSSIVSISKNKKDVFISITVDEGKKYRIGKLAISGALPEKINIDDIKKNILVSEGQVFNRKLINTSSKNISNLLGNYGYAFANVNPVPSVDKDNLIVDFNFAIDQGKKIYVRRINIIGNETTKDEVIRRELRQYESSWFSQEKIDLSKQRLNRTQYFEAVNVETPIVPGNPDQVDINVLLKETNTGKFQIGAGVSSSEGIVGSLSLSQSNFLGTGNTISTEVSTGGINKVWSLRFIDPYWTEDGVSRGFNAYYQDYDTKELKTGDYQSKSFGLGIDFGIPLDEFKRFNFGGTFDFTELNLKSDSPQKYKDYCANLSGAGSMSCQADSFLLFTSWSDNNLDNPFFPTTGYKISANFDITTPGLDLEYYKASLKGEKFYPLSSSVTTKIRGAIGYADRYGDEVYPIFKNFKVGGKSSIRGYKEGSVGKKTFDSSSGRWVTYGGRKMFSFGAETYFPVPFVEASESYRMSIFFDGGATFEDSLNGGDIRYSAGLGGLWMSPFGPLSVSIAMPLNDGEHDQQEKFQFGMGSSF